MNGSLVSLLSFPTMTAKVIIAGGRDFDDYARIDTVMSYLCGTYNDDLGHMTCKGLDLEVVCGLAVGADTLGKDWAKANDIHLVTFPAEWDKYGKAAGAIRNVEMADYADALVAFWDGKSKGTKHMIQTALVKGLAVHVYPY